MLDKRCFCSSWVLATIKDGVWDGRQPVAIKTSEEHGVTLHNKPISLLLHLTYKVLLSHLLRLALFWTGDYRVADLALNQSQTLETNTRSVGTSTICGFISQHV